MRVVLDALVLALLCRAVCSTCDVSIPHARDARGAGLLQVTRNLKSSSFSSFASSFCGGHRLAWRLLRRFPPPRLREPVASCKRIGRQFPELVSRNQSMLREYADYACHNGSSYFLTDPGVALRSEVTEVHGGCVNLMRWPRKVIAANVSHLTNAFRTCDRRHDKRLEGLDEVAVDHDVMIISTTHLPSGMEYQHTLLDFLPGAWSVLGLVNGTSRKLVVHTPLQQKILEFVGLPSANILQLPFPKRGAFLLCTPRHSMHLWRIGGDDGELPIRRTARAVGDFWHRLISFQVGHELSDAIAKAAGWNETEELSSRQITFMQRCSSRRALANEQELLGAMSAVLIDSNRTEELVTMCGGRLPWLTQVQQVRRSKLLVGAHGGAMANMLFARPSTGIIEIVGSVGGQRLSDPKGIWPAYHSHWYGGAGASFKFYRVALYEQDHSELRARTDDGAEALREWIIFADKQELKN